MGFVDTLNKHSLNDNNDFDTIRLFRCLDACGIRYSHLVQVCRLVEYLIGNTHSRNLYILDNETGMIWLEGISSDLSYFHLIFACLRC